MSEANYLRLRLCMIYYITFLVYRRVGNYFLDHIFLLETSYDNFNLLAEFQLELLMQSLFFSRVFVFMDNYFLSLLFTEGFLLVSFVTLDAAIRTYPDFAFKMS